MSCTVSPNTSNSPNTGCVDSTSVFDVEVLREHYLHTDVVCGVVNCGKCKFKESPSILTREKSISETIMDPHLIILDVYVAFNQIDLLEDDVLKNVVICRTGLEEAKNRSPALYKRLLNVIKDTPKQVYLFPNDCFTETYIERWPNESKILYQERSIRKATAWYQKHLENKITVYLVTDDSESLGNAEKEGLNVIRAHNYFTSIKDFTHIEARFLLKRTFSKLNDQKKTYSKHLTSSEIQKGLKSRKYFKGVYYPSRDSKHEGTVNIISADFPFDAQQMLVQGQNNINRAIDGDIVAVEVFHESQWANFMEMMNSSDSDSDDESVDDLLERKKEKYGLPCGRVVGIMERKLKQYCGILEAPVLENANRILFVPANRKIPKIRVRTSKFDELKSQRIVAVIDLWPTNSRFPEGHIVKILGNIGDRETENEVLLIENDIPHYDFSKNVLDCLPQLPWIITDEDVNKRTDLRHVDICSVDPPGCTDIDDALHCSRLENGNYEVGVHIADVSHFIRPGTALDMEAANRASTVYLVDKRIDMVPELLSSNLCSLRGNEERFAVSCIWELTPNAEIINTHFCKSIILSKSAMTYQEAQMIIDDPEQQHNLAQSLRSLNSLAKIIKQRRIENGALLLASTEVRFSLNSETCDPIEPEAKKLMDTNSMVEEFMILANISAGTKILEEFPECAMLRRHPPPSTHQIEELVNVGRILGVTINVKSGKELAQSLEEVNKPENQYFNNMLKIVVTRCMNQALYFPSGMLKMKDYHHYGLALPIYTHFTSPIRRYADIVVHRLLAVCIDAEDTYPDLLDKKKSQDLCNNLNYRNRMARQAGRASVTLFTHIFLRDKILEEEGYILFVRKNCLQVYIPKYGLDGSLYLADKKDCNNVPFIFSTLALTQTCGDVTFRMFDPVTVQLSLDRTNLQHEKLILKLVKPEIPSFSVPSVAPEL